MAQLRESERLSQQRHHEMLDEMRGLRHRLDVAETKLKARPPRRSQQLLETPAIPGRAGEG